MYIKAHTITSTQMNAGIRSGEEERLMLFIISQVISWKHIPLINWPPSKSHVHTEC
jgi:hypothetical protein